MGGISSSQRGVTEEDNASTTSVYRLILVSFIFIKPQYFLSGRKGGQSNIKITSEFIWNVIFKEKLKFYSMKYVCDILAILFWWIYEVTNSCLSMFLIFMVKILSNNQPFDCSTFEWKSQLCMVPIELVH